MQNLQTGGVMELLDTDIRWTLNHSPWPASRPVLEVALDALPVIEDDIAAELIVRLANTVADLRSELASLREVQSASMTFAAAQQGQARSARQRLADHLKTLRPAR